MKFALPMDMKMPTFVGIFIFISGENFIIADLIADLSIKKKVL